MTFIDDRVPMVCIDCNHEFLAQGAWQTRCRTCYAWYRRFIVGEPAPTPAAMRARIAQLEAEIADLLRQLEAARAEAAHWRQRAQHPPRPRTAKLRIPREHWRRLVQLAHPDRHGNSEAATEATRWLLENRPP